MMLAKGLLDWLVLLLTMGRLGDTAELDGMRVVIPEHHQTCNGSDINCQKYNFGLI